MVERKLSDEDCKHIARLIDQGHQIKDLAKQFNVDRSVISRRCKGMYNSKKIPVETKNKVIKAIKEGYTKAEAAELYGLNIGSVVMFTKHLQGHSHQGNHIIRRNGIELIRRLLSDGYLISDFIVSTARNLQRHFPMILSARYRGKTFFYLKGREEATIEAFFREKPDRVINYKAIRELGYLLGVKLSNKDQYNLLEKFKKKHDDYWNSRRLIQRCLDDWADDAGNGITEYVGESFRLFPKL